MTKSILPTATDLVSHPPVRCTPKVLSRSQSKLILVLLPPKTLDGNLSPVDAHNVEGVFFTATAGGRRRSGLYHERRVPFDLVALGRVHRVAGMKMTGQKNISAATRQRFHCHPRASDKLPFVVSFRQIEGMMRDDDPRHLRVQGAELLLHPRDLFFINSTTLDRQRASSIDAEHRDFFVMIKRLQVFGDVAAILVERLKEPRPNIVERNVVIARHHELRLRQKIEKSSGLFELMGARALRQVTGDGYEIRIYLEYGFNQRSNYLIVDATEVNVREM